MSTYLGRMYEIHPNSELEVVQTDCLMAEYQPPVSQNWVEHVKVLDDMYNFAVKRYGHYKGLTAYNNSAWYKAEATSFYEFMRKFEDVNREQFIERYGVIK